MKAKFRMADKHWLEKAKERRNAVNGLENYVNF
jgi:hypothetical protein